MGVADKAVRRTEKAPREIVRNHRGPPLMEIGSRGRRTRSRRSRRISLTAGGSHAAVWAVKPRANRPSVHVRARRPHGTRTRRRCFCIRSCSRTFPHCQRAVRRRSRRCPQLRARVPHLQSKKSAARQKWRPLLRIVLAVGRASRLYPSWLLARGDERSCRVLKRRASSC